jgi:hypothetical protein
VAATAAVLILVAQVTAIAVAGSVEAAPIATSDGVLAGHTMSGDPVPCAARLDGVRVCHGDIGGPDGEDLRLQSFDGVPLAMYVTLPAAPAQGVDGSYPLIVQSHGWGAPPSGADDGQYGGVTAAQWARQGYVVLQLAARGWGNSCGSAASRQVDAAACAGGYIRLDDYRYEVRDIQNAVGLLVDDGLADPARIGAVGESYGGGATLALATLDDRVMDLDGSLQPWVSPAGTPLRIAGAVPLFGWSDMVSALMPNGGTLDSTVTSTTDDLAPIGVWKQTIGGGLYLAGALGGYYAPVGLDPEADVTAWFGTLAAGGPYDTGQIRAIQDQITRFRSPYYLLAGDHGVARQQPPPLLLVSGFTDAVFPAEEYVRYYNLERALYPGSDVSMLFYDGGHQRGQNKAADGAVLVARLQEFMNHEVAGVGPRPTRGVTALTQTCPATAPSGGPFRATTWDGLHPGTVTFLSSRPQTVSSAAGDPAVGEALEPIFGGLACTTVTATDQGPGVATYRWTTGRGSGFTLLGAPTVRARVQAEGSYAYLAARLFDVDPVTNTEVLVSRGVYRIDPDAPDGLQKFQLTANGWHFAAGHVPKLELLGQDAPYLLPSNQPFSVRVSHLELSLPVHERTCATVPYWGPASYSRCQVGSRSS